MKRILLSFLLLISFGVMGQTPVITSFHPFYGAAGTLLTITGTDLASPTVLTIGGVNALVISNTGTSLVAMVMPGATTGTVSVSTAAGTASGIRNFTVIPVKPPSQQQGAKLVGSGYMDYGLQGTSVAISADGKTAVVGAPFDKNSLGAVWIYTRDNNRSWSQQGPKLVGNGSTGTGSKQGQSVALSADGNTAIVGGPKDGGGRGAVWVYIRTGNTWHQQGNKLVYNVAGASIEQGSSVALSADGNTALVGGTAVLVYTRTNAVWTLQQSNLQAFPGAVALSADGNTAVIGVPSEDNAKGGGWIYTRNGTVWTQQGSLLKGSAKSGAPREGSAVAVSADGNTVILGGPEQYQFFQNTGAAWIYTRSGGTWTQQGAQQVGAYGAGARQGTAVSLSADGNLAIVGGPEDDAYSGASWIFGRTNGVWGQLTDKVFGNGNTGTNIYEGSSTGLSADGSTAIAGAIRDDGGVGAAWVYTYNSADLTALTVSAGTLIPAFDPAVTDYTIRINDTARVMLMPVPEAVNSDVTMKTGVFNYEEIAYDSLTLAVGVTPVVIRVASGDGVTDKNYRITFSRYISPVIHSFTPASGPAGTLVNIKGTGLVNLTELTIGGKAGIVLSNTDSTIVAMVMPGTTTGNISFSSAGGTAVSNSSFTLTPALVPNAQQGTKLVGSGNAGNPRQGWSVALSADGNTAIVGGFQDDNNIGAAWIYTRRNGVWKQQGAKLVGLGYTSAARQGEAVALSADGNTAIVGGSGENNGKGAAWIYTRTDSTWTQQGNKLMNTSNGRLWAMGIAVSLSADGNTALVRANEGATIFIRSQGNWTLQSDQLPGAGHAAAISADANTAVLGGSDDDNNQGAGWIYTRNGTAWQREAKLIGDDHTGASWEGNSVAISADGNTVVLAGNYDNNSVGAAWVYTRSSGSWTQQGDKLVGTGGSARTGQGTAVSVSADGNTILLGGSSDGNAKGAVWMFSRTGGIWKQQGAKLSGKDNGGFASEGYAAFLSADASTAITGGFNESGTQGAAWIYVYKNSDANLAALTISAGTLNPAFDSTVTNYTVNVSNSTAKLTVTPTLSDPTATVIIKINGTAITNISDSLILNAGLNTINVQVTAADGAKTKTYNISVRRELADQLITFGALANHTYGDADFNLTATGGASGNAITYSSSNPLIASVNGNTVKILAAGTVIITASQPGNTNYNAAISVTQPLTIDKKVITVIADIKSKTYGDADPVFTFTATPVPVNTFTGSLSRNTGENAGTYTINQNTLALNTNYSINYTTADLTINKKVITITADAKSKTYGDADPVFTFTATPVPVNTFTGSLSRNTGENAGTYTISQNTLALSTNYILNYTAADLTINKKVITITADAKSKTYGDADPAFTFTATPVPVNTFTGSLSRNTGENAGTYTINQNTLALNTNYSINYTTADLTINKKVITITADAKSKTYGDTDPAFTFTATPVPVNTFTGNLSRNAGEDAGTYTISQNTLALSTNYILNYTTADLTINKKVITITADAKSKTYGDADPAFTFTATPVPVNTFTGNLSRNAGEDAGTYTVSQNTLALTSNYILNYTAASFSISQKQLTITADNKSRIYGVTNPVLTATYTGFAGTDNESVLSTPVSLTTTANINTVPGTYPVNITGGAALNYSISLVNGILNITAASQSIHFSALADKLSTDNTFMLTATATSGLTVSYSSSDPAVVRINGNEAEILKTGTVIITATQDGNASYTAAAPVMQQLNIIDNPLPLIKIESNKGNSISKGETVMLMATGADTYSWETANGIISGQNTSLLTVRPSTTTTYTVTGLNQYGRSNTQTFTLEVKNDLQVTNATNILTPDGDGINDYWIVENIDMYPDNEVKIFDRSGRTVYMKKGYTNDWRATVNGMPLAEGTYYYIINFGEGTRIKKGFITVIRR